MYIPIQQFVIPLFTFIIIVNILLSLRVWLGNTKNPVNIFYSLAVLSTVFWIFFELATFYFFTDRPQLTSLFVRLAYFFPILTTFFLYLFTLYFPYRTKKDIQTSVITLAVFAGVVSVLIFIPGLIVDREVDVMNSGTICRNIAACSLFGVYFVGAIILALTNLIMKYKQTDGIWRKRLKQIMVGTYTALAAGTVFTFILPAYFQIFNFYWLGHASTLFLAFYFWWYIFRKRYDEK